MSFEIGKYYQHTNGDKMSIVGNADTTMYGDCLIAEHDNYGNFTPVAKNDPEATVNWKEITKGAWLSSFDRERGLPPNFKEVVLSVDTVYAENYIFPKASVQEFLNKIKNEDIKIYGTLATDVANGEIIYEISHEVKNLRIEGQSLVGTICINGGPKGWELWDLMQSHEVEFKCSTTAVYEDLESAALRYPKDLTITAIHAYVKEKNDAT